jgi:starch synthase (maltosyl-transferring)
MMNVQAAPTRSKAQVVPTAFSADDGRKRAVIENVTPQVDCGRFPVKRVINDRVSVEADVFTDGHDAVRCAVRYRHESDAEWHEMEMSPLVNDRWCGAFITRELGRYRYSVIAWTDRLLTWRRDLVRRQDPQDVLIALRVGAQLLDAAAHRASGDDTAMLTRAARLLQDADDPVVGRTLALDETLSSVADRYPDRSFATRFDRELEVIVDPPLARFSAWYEFFPRSAARAPGRHGTFKDCEAMLPYVADLGFDIVYFPPIHPVGRTRRKGANNALAAGPNDVGSPWAIGAHEGGHKSIHPDLGTLEDFKRLVARANDLGIEVALDIAFQCAPDHPYVAQHPEWFRWRPDNTVQYAENPPKKYQDIYPFDFETDAWRPLQDELTSIVLYWLQHGVKVFRVDNPHTKPYPLWERLIATVKQQEPRAIFLAEAFTRPKVMHRLAKLGFSQSYTYFTWRNTKRELQQYFTELTCDASREYFRPNVWPNTPDILPEYLQYGGRAAFMTRLLLAATLSTNYGIYGPAFELMEHEAREPGSEEYRDSEKYQLRHWDLERPDSLRHFIKRVNQLRRELAALQTDWSVKFLPIDNEQLLAYARTAPELTDIVVVVANLDPHNVHTGWLELPLADFGLSPEHPYRMQDLLGGGSYLWQGSRNFVRLDPNGAVGHVFKVAKRVRTEREFDYFL